MAVQRLASRLLAKGRRSTTQAWTVVGSTLVITIAAITLCLTYYQRSGLQILDHASLVPRNGNTVVANDIYGTGVRVGAYMQIIGMLMTSSTREAGGIKLAISGTMIALIATWTVLAARRAFSPCESLIILTLIGSFSLIGTTTATEITFGIGNIVLLIAGIWTVISAYWFWSTLLFRLPLLGTENYVWIFTRVNILGGYRIFMLVWITLTVVIVILQNVRLYRFRKEIQRALRRYASQHGEDAAQKQLEQFQEDAKEEAERERIWTLVGQAITLIFVIATIEMTIKYNNLEPETDLSLPGQTIPFSIGLVVLLDGLVLLIGQIIKWIND